MHQSNYDMSRDGANPALTVLAAIAAIDSGRWQCGFPLVAHVCIYFRGSDDSFLHTTNNVMGLITRSKQLKLI